MTMMMGGMGKGQRLVISLVLSSGGCYLLEARSQEKNATLFWCVFGVFSKFTS